MIDTSNAPKNAAEKEDTVNPLTTWPIYQKIKPLITRENRPRVTIFKGKVKIFTIGLMNILKSERQAPTISTDQRTVTVIPDTTLDAKNTATEIIIQCKINLIKILIK